MRRFIIVTERAKINPFPLEDVYRSNRKISWKNVTYWMSDRWCKTKKKYIKSDKQSMYQYAKNQHLYETTL